MDTAPDTPAARTPALGLEFALYGAGLAIAVLALVAPAGLWTFRVRHVPAAVFPALVVVALGWALWTRRRSFGASLATEPDPRRATLFALVFAAAAGLVLWQLRCRVPYGDAGAIAGFIDRGVVFHKREPLSPALFLLVHEAVGRSLGWPPQGTIQVVNTMAGAAGAGALFVLARLVVPAHTGVKRGLVIAALISTGALQLFAGYIENYTLPTVCMLWALVFALRALGGQRGLTAAFAFWTLSTMFHLSGAVFAPAMLWLYWRAGLGGDVRRIPTTVTVRVLSVTLLPAGLLFSAMLSVGFLRAEESGFGGGDGRMFVPLFEAGGMSQYLFLRPAHLLAVTNQQLLVAPLGVLACALALAALGRRAAAGALPFVVLVAGAFFSLTLLWNPDLGALRDWDLFGPVGFYVNVCAVALLAQVYDRHPARLQGLLGFIAAVNLCKAVPFLLHNARL